MKSIHLFYCKTHISLIVSLFLLDNGDDLICIPVDDVLLYVYTAICYMLCMYYYMLRIRNRKVLEHFRHSCLFFGPIFSSTCKTFTESKIYIYAYIWPKKCGSKCPPECAMLSIKTSNLSYCIQNVFPFQSVNYKWNYAIPSYFS